MILRQIVFHALPAAPASHANGTVLKNRRLHAQPGFFGKPSNGFVLGGRFNLPQNRLEMRLVRLAQETVVRQFDDCPAGRLRQLGVVEITGDPVDRREGPYGSGSRESPILVVVAIGEFYRVFQHPEGFGLRPVVGEGHHADIRAQRLGAIGFGL